MKKAVIATILIGGFAAGTSNPCLIGFDTKTVENEASVTEQICEKDFIKDRLYTYDSIEIPEGATLMDIYITRDTDDVRGLGIPNEKSLPASATEGDATILEVSLEVFDGVEWKHRAGILVDRGIRYTESGEVATTSKFTNIYLLPGIDKKVMVNIKSKEDFTSTGYIIFK